ncbi:MAG: sulfotransferase family protein [Pseudomonas sp.]|jgi:sulfotransferase|uniref:sulfotransferase family protein n=1 Tax=Pseudomonas sp. TaxID=306 RepID=UPI0026134F01|nr:sulfotransferase [Pseudomonas sp.]MDB6052003.1 sulfotransferase family protein [Pseudomonas sp.]
MTERTLHFISGLPRSGSTLLSALLRQNPRFHANMSGPVAGMVNDLLNGMSGSNEYSLFITDQQRQRILRGLFEQFYGDEFAKPVIFDSNRAWCSRMGLLQSLFPDSKVIACVRDVPWIIDSIERLVQRNTFSPSALFNFQAGGTVYSRADTVAGADGLLGYPYNALKEAFYGAHTKNLLLVRYESLVSAPQAVLKGIYAFINQPSFKHDVHNIEFDAQAFDLRAGMPGLHDVKPSVQASARPTILPPDVFARFSNDAFWQHPQHNLQGVKIL